MKLDAVDVCEDTGSQLVGEYDVVIDTLPRSLPIELSAEVIGMTAPRNALLNSTDAADRECLTRYMYGYPEQFRITNISIEFCRIPLWVWL